MNLVNKRQLLSGSWDDSIKLWDLTRPQSLRTFGEHTYCVYGATWCATPFLTLPTLPPVIGRCSTPQEVTCTCAVSSHVVCSPLRVTPSPPNYPSSPQAKLRPVRAKAARRAWHAES